MQRRIAGSRCRRPVFDVGLSAMRPASVRQAVLSKEEQLVLPRPRWGVTALGSAIGKTASST